MNQKIFKIIGKIFILLFTISFFFCASMVPAQAGTTKLKFGSAIALTGKFARNGVNLKKAYDLWAEVVNSRGGIEIKGKKYPVEIIYYDDKSDPRTTTKLVEKLITQDKVDLIFGPFSSSCVGPSSTITEKYKVPMIETAGNARKLFTRGFKYLFTTLCPADEIANPQMKMLVKLKPRPKTVAVIAPDRPFYMSAAKGFKEYSEKYGFNVVHYEEYPAELKDITPVLQKVKAKNPDVLMVGSHTVPAMNVMRQSKQIDLNPKAYIFSFGTIAPDFIKEMGKDGEYVFEFSCISANAPFKGPFFRSAKNFLDYFQEKVGVFPDVTQACAFSAGVSFMTALQQTGATPPLSEKDRMMVRDELARLDIMTSAGPVRFDSIGFNIANPLCIYQIQGGKMVCVDPPEWATGKIVYPTPKWSER